MLIIIIILFIIVIYLLKLKKEYFLLAKGSGCRWLNLNISDYYKDKFIAKIDYIFKLGNKYKLCSMFKDKYYSPKCFTIKQNTDIPKDFLKKNTDTWFIKQVGKGGGSGIYPCLGKDVNYKLEKFLTEKDSSWVIQKGVKDHLLYENKKIDGRAHYLVILYKNELFFYIYKDLFFRISSKNYNKNNLSRNSQTTNINTLKKIIIDDLNNKDIIIDKTVRVFKDISKELKINKPKEKSKYTLQYQLIAADIIFDKNYNLYLLELNARCPAYLYNKDNIKIVKMKKKIKYGIEQMITNVFNNKHFNLENNGFIRVL